MGAVSNSVVPHTKVLPNPAPLLLHMDKGGKSGKARQVQGWSEVQERVDGQVPT